MNRIFIVLVLVTIMSFSPSNSTNSQKIGAGTHPSDVPVSHDIIQLQKDNLNLNNQIIENVHVNQPKPKIKTKIIEKKPDTIILYVRDMEGNISEHPIGNEGGFYIIDQSELEDTTSPLPKKTFWDRFK